MKVLITGFEPLWGIKRTPSGDLANLWEKQEFSIPGIEVRGLVLPQLFRKCTEIACSEISNFKPDFVLMYGATKKNGPIRFERFAINVELSSMGDNSKIPVQERPIDLNGPTAYESTLPIDYLKDMVNEGGVSAKISQFAGTHVCNSVFYGVRRHIDLKSLPTRAGFIHMTFPNEYGVFEDGTWNTMVFPELFKASVLTISALKTWKDQKHT